MKEINVKINEKDYTIFILEDIDTQKEVDAIKDYLVKHWDEFVNKENIRYIKPSNRFIAQLPEEWEIKL